jgi:recombination protein RecA
MASGALARTDLEALLRARKLDRTLQPPEAAGVARQAPPPSEARLATGLAPLDQRLGGGLPRGQMSELVGPRSSGRTTLMCAALAAATGRGELAALVDPLDAFDPESAAACGVVLDRLLWLRGEETTLGGLPPREKGQSERLLDRALKAVNLVLQAGGFDLVVLDLAEVSPEAIRRLPFATWFRLQRVVEGSRTACLLLGPAPIARSVGGASIQLAPSRQGVWNARLFLGLDVQARIVRARDPEDGRCRLAARACGC